MSTIAIHPEAVDGEADALRWVVPAALFEFVGDVGRVPPALQDLLSDRTLVSIDVEPTAVRTRIGPGKSWRREGARVRTAMVAALSELEQWAPSQLGDSDDVVRMAVEEVIAGEVGRYIRSHGGEVELVSVHDGDVDVRMSGTCEHCPAFAFTLVNRFEAAVRLSCPQVEKVTSRSGEKNAAAAAWERFGLTPHRRA